MNELLKVTVTENEEQTVRGRELHAFLEIETPYKKWFDRMCEYGFVENADFLTVDKNVHGQNGQIMPQKQHDHILKLNMAKELCMLARNEKGKQARQYFLQIERDWNSPEKVMARALRIANKKLLEVEAKLEEAKPKMLFADAVVASDTTILIGELAKIIKQNGYDIGQKRMFSWLRQNGYLINRKGTDWNSPTQRSMEMGLFKIHETVIYHNNGEVDVKRTTKVTGKGQTYFVNKFLGEKHA